MLKSLDCPEVMGPCCLNSEDVKGLQKNGKAAGPTAVMNEMMKVSGGFGTRWISDLINSIVKADYSDN